MIEWKKVKVDNYNNFYNDTIDNFMAFGNKSELLTRGNLIIWDKGFEEYSDERLKCSMFANNFQDLLLKEPLSLRIKYD